jgi:hypothetical protein
VCWSGDYSPNHHHWIWTGSRVHHHDSVVKVQAAPVSRAQANKKPGVSARLKVADTWRRFWPHGQRVSRREEPECELLRLPGGVRRRRRTTVAKYTTGLRRCQMAVGVSFRDCVEPGEPGTSWQRGGVYHSHSRLSSDFQHEFLERIQSFQMRNETSLLMLPVVFNALRMKKRPAKGR